MSGASVGAQFISLAFIPFITNLYSPEEFGVLGSFSAIFFVFTPLLGLGYQWAIVTAESEEDVLQLRRLVIAAGSVMSVFFAFFYYLLRDLGAVSAADTTHWLWAILMGLGLFGSSLYIAEFYTCSREQRFVLIGLSNLLRSLIANVAKVCLGLVYATSLSLVAVTVLAPFIALYVLRRGQPSSLLKSRSSHPKLKLEIEKKYSSFLRFKLPQTLAVTIGEWAPMLIVPMVVAPAAVGSFFLARTILGAMQNSLGKVLSEIIFSAISRKLRKQSGFPSKKIGVIFAAMAGILAFPYLAVYLASEKVVPILFGSAWFEAGAVLSILSVLYYFDTMFRACGALLAAVGKLRAHAIIESTILFAKIIIISASAAVGAGLYEIVFLYTVFTSAVLCLSCFVSVILGLQYEEL